MSQSEQFDNQQSGNDGMGTVSDTYTTESSADIYQTPDVSIHPFDDTPVEEAASTEEKPLLEEMASLEEVVYGAEPMSGDAAPEAAGEHIIPDDNPYENNVSYGSASYGGQPAQNDNFYGGQPVPNDSPYGNKYISAPNGNSPYGNRNSYGGNQPGSNPYYGQPMQGDNSYRGQPVQNANPYGGQPAQNANPYVGQPAQNDNLYGGQSAQNANLYGGQPAQNYNAYSGQPMQNGNQYGVPPYGNNQFSPYAVPPKKNSTGLIIGIVAAVVLLFLIAVGALVYKVVSMYADAGENRHANKEEYDFDDWEKERERKENYDNHHYDDNDNDDSYNYDDDYGYDDSYDDDYDYDSDEYYTLHDDIQGGLSYTVDFEYYEYDSNHENVDILVLYPVIENSDESIPNLDKLNATIESEVDFLVEYYEDEYGDYFIEDDDSYFHASSTGYVTYMDEEKMSIVFSENVYADDGRTYYSDAFLYSINIDMENGIILENESMLNVDDEFSVEFREKSDIQNGEISSLTMMSDQEITGHFDSSDIIVFYTPQGMEIGFNYDEGWVTVTYKDYEQYLKVF